MVYGGRAERDVSATFDCELYNENDKLLMKIGQVGAGTTLVSLGALNDGIGAGDFPFPFPMKAGWYIKYTWGAEQVTPEVALIVSKMPR